MSGIGNLKVVGLDSNLFIYHFENNPDFTIFTTKVFDRLSNEKLRGVTSIISVVETLSFPSTPEVIKDIQNAFSVVPNLRIIDVNQQIAIEAARIRREYKFRLPDSIQIATALISKAQAFISN